MHEYEVIEIKEGSSVIHDSDMDLLIVEIKSTAYTKGIVYVDLINVVDFEISTKFVVLKKDKVLEPKSSIVRILKQVK